MKIISVLIGILILYILQSILYTKYWHYNLSAKVSFKENRIDEGKAVIIEECIENKKWLPLPMITMKYNLSNSFIEKKEKNMALSDRYNRNVVFSALMYQRIIRKVEFICKKRGVYKIENLNILVGNLLLNETHLCELESDSELVVYPRCVDVSRFMKIYNKVYGNIITNNFVIDDPFTFRGVREYQIYDRMKMINWGASAKTGELKVNVLENTSQREAVIFLNLQRDTMLLNSEVLEESIRLVKTFCKELCNNGIRSYIYSNGRNIFTKEIVKIDRYDSTKNYMDIVNDALSKIEVKDVENVYTKIEEDGFVELYKEKIKKISEGKYIIFISNYQRNDFQNMLIDLKKNNREFIWIVPVSNRNDYHITNELIQDANMWRLNWEGANYGNSKDE